MARHYAIFDVFTRAPLSGNPLAVVFDAQGLDEKDMHAIAREFNLSETVFVCPSSNPSHIAKLRIFTASEELKFAGHPTVGAAIALAALKAPQGIANWVCVLEEKIGPIRVAVKRYSDGIDFAEFDLPCLPQKHNLTFAIADKAISEALNISSASIGFENHRPAVYSAGLPFLLVPVKDRKALSEIGFDSYQYERLAPFVDGHLVYAYVYTRLPPGGDGSCFSARMFTVGCGGPVEDPATGSGAAALSGAIVYFDRLLDGHHNIRIEQGKDMGRPSEIFLHLETEKGKITQARIGGYAVKVADGQLL